MPPLLCGAAALDRFEVDEPDVPTLRCRTPPALPPVRPPPADIEAFGPRPPEPTVVELAGAG